jgi:amyloid beta precursor protein binding protein 1
LESWVTQDKVFLDYTLVLIAAPIDPAILNLIDIHLQALQIPTFYFHTLGYYAHFSVYLPSAFPIVDTHPDPTATTDLRLLKPWPALTAFARQKTANMDKMNGEEFAHIPYVCLLLHYLAEWQSTHDGNLPQNYKEKTAFRALVRAGSPNEENFDEAVAAVLKLLNPAVPSSDVRSILTAPETNQLQANAPPFWFIANAIQQFYAKHNELPLPGAVPDMKANSETYIQLQNLYKAKARQDCEEVTQTVRELEAQTGRPPAWSIDAKEIENFCKGAAHISLVRGRPLKIVQPGKPITFGDRAKLIVQELTNPESLIGLYIAFLAWDQFIATHTSPSGGEGLKVPGSGAEDFQTDTLKLQGIAHKILDDVIKEAGTFLQDPEYTKVKTGVAKLCLELARAGGAELHNLASLSGGLIAQEVIKVITRQYVPVDNTCVFDGVGSRAYVVRI